MSRRCHGWGRVLVCAMSGHVQSQQQEWQVCRTWSSDSLSPELYGWILDKFEKEGPEKVLQEMSIPHFTNKLPQQPVCMDTVDHIAGHSHTHYMAPPTPSWHLHLCLHDTGGGRLVPLHAHQLGGSSTAQGSGAPAGGVGRRRELEPQQPPACEALLSCLPNFPLSHTSPLYTAHALAQPHR